MSEDVIWRAGKCGHHHDPDCGGCRLALAFNDAELERLRAEIEGLRVLLQETKNGLIGNTAIMLGGKNRDEAHKAGSRLNDLIDRIDAALSNEGEG